MSAEGELWPCLLEKAIAKVFGGYQNLNGSEEDGIHRVWQMLTGAAADETMIIDRQEEEDGQWLCGSPTWPLEPASQGDERREWVSLVQMLGTLDELGCIMTASSSGSAESAVNGVSEDSEGLNTYGIVPTHAYSLLNVRLDAAGSGFDLVQLRNPWGSGEWKGAWADSAPEWEAHSAVRDALHVGSAANDGRFWMSVADFFYHFGELHVCIIQAGRQRKLELEQAHAEQTTEEREHSEHSEHSE